MPLFGRNFQELNIDSLEELGSQTNITKLSAGSKARSIIEAVNRRLEEQYEIFDLNLARAFVSSASGQFLDLIGELLGVARDGAHAAEVIEDTEILKVYVESGTFGDINGNKDIILSRGVSVSTQPNGGGTVYYSTFNKTLLATESYAFLSVEAASPGAESNVGANALRFHTFRDYEDNSNNTLKVTNVHPIDNGRNIESDANYRFRIVNRALEAEAGNETAIRLAILSTPGVADALILPRYRGIGTFGIIIKSTTPVVTQTLIESVEVSLLNVISLGDIAFVRKPKETGISFRFTIHYSKRLPEEELEDIEGILTDAITRFVNDLDLGESLFINQLVAELFDISSNISNFGQPGKPIDEVYIYQDSQLEDNRTKSTLLGDYTPDRDERIIIEPYISNPISFTRKFIRR